MANKIDYDVIVVGAGISGSATARELARYDLSILVLEAGYDLACGASRTNSGIVHGGYDPVPGTAKAHYNALGARMIPELAKELGFRYKNTGSMVIALSEFNLQAIDELVERAKENGIDDVRRISAEEARTLEPNVNPDILGALLCEGSGICDPFGMTVAFAENAVANGAEFRFRTRVADIVERKGYWKVVLENGDALRCRAVVNAAGVYAIGFHNRVTGDELPEVPRLGEYVLLDRTAGETFSHTMFQAPGPLGKGVLVSPTVEGNIIVGPDAVDVEDVENTATTPEGITWVAHQAKQTWPELNRREVIANFAGVRPSGADGDFVIGEPEGHPGFFDIAAFDSPGLSSAPAVAVDVAAQVAERLGADERDGFEPHRDMPARFIEMDEDERLAAIERDPAFAHLICRCEEVTEAEVLEAIHAPIPATTVTGVKRRCRAGTGRCQGGFCAPLVAEMISEELSIPLSEVCLAGDGSEMAPLTREVMGNASA